MKICNDDFEIKSKELWDYYKFNDNVKNYIEQIKQKIEIKQGDFIHVNEDNKINEILIYGTISYYYNLDIKMYLKINPVRLILTTKDGFNGYCILNEYSKNIEFYSIDEIFIYKYNSDKYLSLVDEYMQTNGDIKNLPPLDNMYIRIDNNYYRKEKLNRILYEI